MSTAPRLTSQQRARRIRALQRLTADRDAAEAALLVGIADAADAGLSQRDTAYALGLSVNSFYSIRLKIAKGRAIREGKK